MQWILFITFISIFIATAIIGLLGVTERLHVKPAYLKALFAALLIELVGVVISQYDKTSFIPDIDSILISQLPSQHQSATSKQSLKNINKVLNTNKKHVQKITMLGTEIKACTNKLKITKEKLNNCTIPNSGMLSTLLRLQEDIKVHGPTVNFLWQPEKKKNAAFRVMNVLGELGFFRQTPTHDPVKASDILKLYQISKGIEPASGKLGRKTFIQLLNDYIIIETNGG